MRVMIVRLADAHHHGVALSLVQDDDLADLVETVDDALALLQRADYAMAILISGRAVALANTALARMRTLAPTMPVLLLTLAPQRGRAAGQRDEARAPILLDPAQLQVSVAGQPVPLSQAEFRIFQALWNRRGETVSAEELLHAIYADAERPSSRVLPVFLFKLRRKLAAVGLDDLVQTSVGRGFSIAAEPGPRP